jgi:hypothetical protein
MSKQRRDGSWPSEGAVQSAAPERIRGMSEKRRDGAWTEAGHNDEVAWGRSREGVVISAAPERIEGRA